eukprot:gene10342-13894_t
MELPTISFRGYPLSIFVCTPTYDFICGICLGIFKNPLMCPNGHNHCKECFLEQLNFNQCCPTCRVPIQSNTLASNKLAKNLIGCMNVRCLFATENQNCTWLGSVDQLDFHLLTCDWAEVECDGCYVRMQRKQISQHLPSDCQNRKVICEFCEKCIKFCDMTGHLDLDCECKPFQCKNGCNAVINKRDLNDHLQVCELESVQCPYNQTCSFIDCNGAIQRKEYDQHLCHAANVVSLMSI